MYKQQALLPVVQNRQECPFYGKNPSATRLNTLVGISPVALTGIVSGLEYVDYDQTPYPFIEAYSRVSKRSTESCQGNL